MDKIEWTEEIEKEAWKKFCETPKNQRLIPELKTQKLIKELGIEGANKYLSEELHIKIKDYGDFFLYNYDQIFSPETNEYVMECRSLQIDKEGNVVSRAYPRFFNYGQHPEITGNFVFEYCNVLQKVDGSMIKIHFNKFSNRWEISTRGTAFGESEQDNFPSFRQAVLEDGFGVTEEEFQEAMDSTIYNYSNSNSARDFTFVFEYCSKHNRIVTYYPDPIMYLCTIVENKSGYEVEQRDIWKTYLRHIENSDSAFCKNIRIPKAYTFSSMEELIKGCEELPDLIEGFVIQDYNGLRIKIKNSLYLKLHCMRGDLGFTKKKMASIVADGEVSEVLTYFPEYTEDMKTLQDAFDNFKLLVNNIWANTKDIESQKDFALKVKDYPFSAILFTMRKTSKSFEEIWTELRESYKVDAILMMDNNGWVIE